MKLKKISKTYTLPHTIKSEWTAYLIFSLIFSPIAVIGTLATLKNPTAWPIALISLIILCAFLIWISVFKIEINKDQIIYHALFSSPKKILFSNIAKAEIKISVFGDAARKGKGVYRFNIYPSLSNEPITINMKPFSKRDLAILSHAIVTKSPTAKIDKKVQKLNEGNFKPVSSEGIRIAWQAVLIFLALLVGYGVLSGIFRVLSK